MRAFRRRDDAGSITLPVLVLVPALLVVAGLVIDGGYALADRQRTYDEAEQAARAGAGAVDPLSLREGTVRLVVDCGGGQPCAQELAAAYVAATADTLVGPVAVTPTTVTVTVQTTRRSVLLSAIGIRELTVHGTGTAEVQRGTTVPEAP